MKEPIFHRDPEILGGEPVFYGTRVPVRNLLDSLQSGETIDEFLEGFPSVTREQAIVYLNFAQSRALETV